MSGFITNGELRIEAERLVDENEGLRERIAELEAENAELREKLAKARDPQRLRGAVDERSFAFAIDQLKEFRWQHATNDTDAIPYINEVAEAHEREVAELNEECEAHVKAVLEGLRRQQELERLAREAYEVADGYVNRSWTCIPGPDPSGALAALRDRMAALGLEAG